MVILESGLLTRSFTLFSSQGLCKTPTLRHSAEKGLHHEWLSRWLKSRLAMLSYKENAPQDGLGREIFPTNGYLAGANFF